MPFMGNRERSECKDEENIYELVKSAMIWLIESHLMQRVTKFKKFVSTRILMWENFFLHFVECLKFNKSINEKNI